eukprot:TRINITY_DN34573_c0_g1_i1.p1 TRINITY_DN34573_c0_g1~~TRINITY_DN34573_c0_g1_i1.p1  ORF type:complete len:269 (+),score=26.37 TRINITY_DN34573_c0_g1_i1:40-846(+)
MATKLYGLLAFTGFTGGLSAWQFHRIFWKKDLLESRTQALSGEPMTKLPKEAPWDICPVRVSGSFYNDSAILVGPKRAVPTEYGEIETPDSYMVFVPFITKDNKHLMVCRGQVPTSMAEDRNKLMEYLNKWPTNTTIEGVFRKRAPPTPGQKIKVDEHLYKIPHAAMMWMEFYEKHGIKEKARNPLPYWIDITDQPMDIDLPLTRNRMSYVEHVISPTVHTIYFITWTCFFIIGCYNLNRHAGRLVRKGLETREQQLGGVKSEADFKW